ncbi:hypothetical protein ABZT45_40645 [Streptomyces sp. NPDC005356]|uniref:hypothetical protein n=1 Tax=Streptomyces sp. NPDC005356 TaxID=3157167 RepID=UPI0033BBFAF1
MELQLVHLPERGQRGNGDEAAVALGQALTLPDLVEEDLSVYPTIPGAKSPKAFFPPVQPVLVFSAMISPYLRRRPSVDL